MQFMFMQFMLVRPKNVPFFASSAHAQTNTYKKLVFWSSLMLFMLYNHTPVGFNHGKLLNSSSAP